MAHPYSSTNVVSPQLCNQIAMKEEKNKVENKREEGEIERTAKLALPEGARLSVQQCVKLITDEAFGI